MTNIEKLPSAWLLVAGIVTLSAAHLIFSADLFGWIAYVPFLLYLQRSNGLKHRLWLFLALIAAWSITVLKIITPPMPSFFVFLYSIPLALIHLPGFLLWNRYRSKPAGLWLFPAAMTLLEWLQYTFTPFASWGVAAYTQSHSLGIQQTLSVWGMPGLSFLIYWVNTALAESIYTRNLRTLYAPLIVVALAVTWGSFRLDFGQTQPFATIQVAAVGTDSEVSGLPLPSHAENERVKAALFDRSRRAARNGARLIVWNEAATFILPSEEPVWLDSLSSLARSSRSALVAAYVKPVSESPLLYENKYTFFDSTGALLHTYLKHQPVPGEPAIPGKEEQTVQSIAGARVGGAICYDYDFPYLAKGFSRLGADIVAVPSSDWRGIDPLHTRMAAFRAIEQGHSVLRSTRFGLSAAISPYGEFRAQMSSFDRHDKIMTAHLPVHGIRTVYARTGDLVIYACGIFIALFRLLPVIRKRNRPVADSVRELPANGAGDGRG